MKFRANRVAFTLLELMAVVAIMGLVFSVVSLRAGGLTDTSRLKAAGRRMESLVRLARSQAVLKNCPVFLRANPRELTLAYDKEEPFARFGLPRNVRCLRIVPENLGRTIRFSPRGTFPSFSAELSNQPGDRIRVRAHGLTGEVSYVSEGGKEPHE